MFGIKFLLHKNLRRILTDMVFMVILCVRIFLLSVLRSCALMTCINRYLLNRRVNTKISVF